MTRADIASHGEGGLPALFSLGSRLKDARLHASVGRFKRVTP